ncbi:hypothetical protein CASFOL_040992 [Castilleja foliolosa]|uniref:Centromere protein O n=1 Tax=Castilleja foliolosa TaxID=1961234 RepID=A0ABD3BE57_9LAMI
MHQAGGLVKEKGFLVNVSELIFSQDEDMHLEATRARFSNILKRHGQLTQRLSRNSAKPVCDRLQKEFEAALTSQTRELCLVGEQWNDGLLATIRERVHVEAERKAMQIQGETVDIQNLPVYEKITYRIGNKILCCLEGSRIGIQYETSYAGESCEIFHCVLKSKSFLEKMRVVEHTVPFFLPLRDTEHYYLSTNAIKFIDHVGNFLQAYVDRREQVCLIKELYGNQIQELHFSLPYNMIEFTLAGFNSKVTVSLRYFNLLDTLPSVASVLAWSPRRPNKKKEKNATQLIPCSLQYAEDALRSASLPEAFAEIVLKIPRALRKLYPEQKSE